MTLTFELPFGLSRRIARRADAYARHEAALIARVYRAIPLEGAREERVERAARNRLARGNARQFLKSARFQRTGVA